MKKVKHSLIILVFLIFMLIFLEAKVYLLEGELQANDASIEYGINKESFTTIQEENFIKDIEKEANEKGLGVYIIFTSTKNFNHVEHRIFGNEKAFQILRKSINFKKNEGKVEGVFTGSKTIKFFPLKELSKENDYGTFYFFGSISKVNNLREALVSDYGGSPVYEGYNGKDLLFYKSFLLIIFLAIIFLISLYYVIGVRKEFAVRFILGESIRKSIFKNVIMDSCILFLSMLMIFYILKIIINRPINRVEFTYFVIGILLVSNLPYLLLLKISPKLGLYEKESLKGFRIFNYTLKGITMVLTVIILSSVLFLVKQSISVIKQEKDWQSLKFYNQYDLYITPVTDRGFEKTLTHIDHIRYKEHSAQILTNIMFKEFYDKNKENAFIFYVPESEKNNIKEYYVNRNGLEIVLKNYPDLVKTFDRKPTGVLYSANNDSEAQINPLYKNEKSKFPYFENIKIFNYNINRDLTQDIILENPTIYLLDDNQLGYNVSWKNTGENEQFIGLENNVNLNSFEHIVSDANESVYFNMQKTPQAYNDFLNDNENIISRDSNFNENNIYEIYQSKKLMYINLLFINMIFVVLFLFFHMFLVQIILKVEFQINATQISLNKILGYSLYRRYRSIYLCSLIVSIISLGMAIGVSIYFGNLKGVYLAVGFLVLLIIEQLILLKLVKKYEALNIPIILKGGIL